MKCIQNFRRKAFIVFFIATGLFPFSGFADALQDKNELESGEIRKLFEDSEAITFFAIAFEQRPAPAHKIVFEDPRAIYSVKCQKATCGGYQYTAFGKLLLAAHHAKRPCKNMSMLGGMRFYREDGAVIGEALVFEAGSCIELGNSTYLIQNWTEMFGLFQAINKLLNDAPWG